MAMDNPVGDITAKVQSVGQGLAELSEVLNGSKATTEADRAQMAQIMDLYVDLVEKKLGGAKPGEDAEEPEAVPMQNQPIPADAGLRGQPVGPQSRN